jgi:hypothetical protein
VFFSFPWRGAPTEDTTADANQERLSISRAAAHGLGVDPAGASIESLQVQGADADQTDVLGVSLFVFCG